MPNLSHALIALTFLVAILVLFQVRSNNQAIRSQMTSEKTVTGIITTKFQCKKHDEEHTVATNRYEGESSKDAWERNAEAVEAGREKCDAD